MSVWMSKEVLVCGVPHVLIPRAVADQRRAVTIIRHGGTKAVGLCRLCSDEYDCLWNYLLKLSTV